jgi:zinc transport system ATP-binding protein
VGKWGKIQTKGKRCEMLTKNEDPPHGPYICFEMVGLCLSNITILQDVSFTVKAGDIHCLIGPNGGGKTSLILSLLGQMPHTGSIEINWIGGTTIGYVPQVLDFDRTLSVTVNNFMTMICQNMPAFIRTRKKYKDIINNALRLVSMDTKGERRLGELSGGEMQRVLFAQALIPFPDLLILDEPGAGIDRGGARVIEEIILDLKKQKVTLVWINHDLKQVRQMADAVTCIHKQVLFSGTPDEVLTTERIFQAFGATSST